MFGFGTIWYLFAAGAGAGLYVVQFCIDPFCRLRRGGPRDMQLLARKLVLLAPVLVCVGSMFLVLDLTRPDRFMLVFRNPDSLISLGACLIVLFVALTSAENGLWNSSGAKLARLAVAVRIGAFAVAVGVVLYTGLFLMGMRGVPFWRSAFIAILFAASSLSSGMALFMLLFVASFKRSRMPRFMRRLSKADSIVLALEVVLIAAFLVAQWNGASAAAEACWRLVAGDLAWSFWVMLVGAGLFCPLMIDVLAGRDESPALLASKSLAVLVGCFFLRYCIMEAGVRALTLQ